MKLRKTGRIEAFIAAVLTSTALFHDLNIPPVSAFPLQAAAENLLDPLLNAAFPCGLLALLLYGLYFRNGQNGQRASWQRGLLAFAFALSVLLGKAFALTGDWSLLWVRSSLQPIKVLWMLAGYCLLAWQALNYVWRGWQSLCLIKDRKEGPFLQWFGRHPFLIAFSFLLLVYLPLAWLYYPTVFMEDSDQFLQMYPELDLMVPTYQAGRLLDPAVHLNQHHPVIHTLLLYGCVELGRVLGSVDTGMFLYTLVQLLTLLTVMAWSVRVVVKDSGLPTWCGILLLLYFAFSPRMQNYAFLMTKDILYAAFDLLFMLQLYAALKGKTDRKGKVLVVFSALGMFFFRNEGKLILLGCSILFALFHKQGRKLWFSLGAGVLVLSLLTGSILYPLLKITPGSRREALSIPFQMTARCVILHEDTLTEDEKATIDRVLDYSMIKEKYEPHISDGIKALYREEAETEDLLRFGGLWLKLMLKHPGTCFQAWFANYGENFSLTDKPMRLYSFEFSLMCMVILNEKCEPLGYRFHLGGADSQQKYLYELVREKLARAPLISLLSQPAVYNWILLAAMVFLAIHRRKRGLLMGSLPMMLLFMCLVGPCNASYGRYEFPNMLMIPVFLLLNLMPEEQESA